MSMVLAVVLPCLCVAALPYLPEWKKPQFPEWKKPRTEEKVEIQEIQVTLAHAAIAEKFATARGTEDLRLCELFPNRELEKIVGPGVSTRNRGGSRSAGTMTDNDGAVWGSEYAHQCFLEGRTKGTAWGDLNAFFGIVRGDSRGPHWTESSKALIDAEKAFGARNSLPAWLRNVPGVFVPSGPHSGTIYCGRSSVGFYLSAARNAAPPRKEQLQNLRTVVRELSEVVCGTKAAPSEWVTKYEREANMLYRVLGGAHPDEIHGLAFQPSLMGPFTDTQRFQEAQQKLDQKSTAKTTTTPSASAAPSK